MKKRTVRVIDLHIQLGVCLSRNSTKVSANAALADGAATLAVRLALEKKFQQELEQIIRGSSLTKNRTREEMAVLTDAMRKRVQACYAFHNNDEGFRNANVTYSAVAYGKYLTGISRARNVYDMADALAAADKTKYGVTPVNLTELDKAIQLCDAANPQVRSNVILRQNAEQNLKDALKQTSKFIQETMDSLMGAYRVTDKSFYNEWVLSRFIMDAASSHAQIAGSVTDAGSNKPLPRVKVIATNGTKVYEDMTDKKGRYKLPVSPELYHLSFELNSYTPLQKADIFVDAGEHEKVNIKLSHN